LALDRGLLEQAAMRGKPKVFLSEFAIKVLLEQVCDYFDKG
jgi:hypothetical protein